MNSLRITPDRRSRLTSPNPTPIAPLSRRDLLRYAGLLGVVGGLAPALAGCGSGSGSGSSSGAAEPTEGLAMSRVARAEPPAGAQEPTVAAMTRFTGAMAARLVADGLEPGGNLVCSPYSVATALGMTVNGARGQTATEMLDVLGGLQLSELNAGLALLDELMLSRTGTRTKVDGETAEVTLSTANSLWGQEGIEWEQSFLDELARWYGAGMHLVDYGGAAEEARTAINGWVSQRTQQKIPELLAAGRLGPATRLVLVNALYLKAPWESPFDRSLTATGTFHTDTGAVSVALMINPIDHARVARGSDWEALSLPYAGRQLAMTVILPAQTDPASHAAWLAKGGIDDVLAALHPGAATVIMPRWRFRTKAQLKPLLTALGMPAAFSDTADFSGMSRDTRLLIDEVVHEGFIAVDEAGTEAAAATAVIGEAGSAGMERFTVRLASPFHRVGGDTGL